MYSHKASKAAPGRVLQLTNLIAELLSLAHTQGVEGFLSSLGSLCQPAHHKWHLRSSTRLGDEVAERRRRKDHKKEAMDMISI